jgi:HEPN domain-containing protein
MKKRENKQEGTDPESRVKSWLEKYKEDLKAAKAMLDARRYLWCGFICQQAIEKYLKAGYVKKYHRIPPYIHKLERLCQELELSVPEGILKAMIDIDKYYVSARYPAYKESVGIKNFRKAESVFTKTKEIVKWLKGELKLQ